MSMTLINHLLPSYGYLAVFLVVALESVGVPLPGETALIAAVLYAGSTHRLNVGLIALVAAGAAIARDNGGCSLGPHPAPHHGPPPRRPRARAAPAPPASACPLHA